ncbi:DUF748 domain-containing protein [Hahella sp. SMD15-11]|uniref:DUF748 domain-containing protein n=1 Tax=Thermohahella caldifontis TaxID=3142973 RepID=A0AB39UWD4_9GAMM
MTPRRRASLIVATILIILIVVPLALIQWGLPWAIRHYYTQFLNAHDLEGTPPVLEVHFLDSGLSLRGLTLRKPDGTLLLSLPEIHVRVEAPALMERQIHIRSLSVADVRVDIRQEGNQWQVAGIPLPGSQNSGDESGPEAPPWTLRLDEGALTSARLALTRAGYTDNLAIDALRIQRLRSGASGLSATLQLDALLNHASRVVLSAEVLSQPAPFIHATLETLTLHREDLEGLVDFPAEMGNATLDLAGEVQYQGGEQPGLTLKAPAIALRNLTAKVRELSVDAAETRLNDVQLDILLPEGQPPEIHLTGGLMLSPLSIEGAAGQWLGWQQLSIPAFELHQAPELSFRAPQAILTDLVVSRVRQPGDTPDAPPLLQTRQLTLDRIDFTPDRLNLESAAFEGAQSLVALDASRNLTTLIPLPGATVSTTEEATETRSAKPVPAQENAPDAPGFRFALNTLTLDSSSAVYIHDAGVNPPFDRSLFISRLRVTDIQNAEPDRPLHVEAALSTDAGAELSWKADIRPFATPVAFTANLTGKQVALPRLSVYLEDALGYRIESGDLDAMVTIQGTPERFEGNASLTLARLNLKGLSGNTASQSTAIPLDVALNQLKEGDGTISLDIPFRQEAGKSDVGLGSFVGLIMKKALYEAAKSYVVNTFVPYANVVSVVALAGEQLFRLRFEPLPMPPDSCCPAGHKWIIWPA